MKRFQGKRMKGIGICLSICLFTVLLAGVAGAAEFCVSTATELGNALATAACNGEDDRIKIVQGTYVGNFIYASTEAFGVTIEGGYTAECASREVDPANTVLDGDADRNVLALSCPDQAVEFVVDGVTLQNGNTSNKGGGLFVSTDNGEVTLTNNTITGNSSSDGGGVYVNGSTVTLTNNTITGNSSGYNGGGVRVNGSTVTLTNNIITGNSGNSGGGVCVCLYENSDTAHIYNNIIYHNTASDDGNDLFIENDGNLDFISSLINLYNNDFDQSASGTYIQLPFPIDPSNLDNLDPLFVDATSGDYHLIESSPCIDAGDNSAPALPETDKDGQPRIMDGIVDMGAYEYPGSAAPVAEFYGSPTSGEVLLEVQFTDQSIGTVDSWSWNFGDGGTSTAQNPSHTYNTPGAYTVGLTVTGPQGSDTETKIDYITATAGPPPTPDIKANGQDGPVFVAPEENVNITVSLDPGDMSGEACDWWIGALTTFGTYWLEPSLNWARSSVPISVGQFELFDLSETSLLDMNLPVGIYTFFFALDNNPNGVFDDLSWYDYVNVICNPEGVQMETASVSEAVFLEKIKELMKQ